MYVLTRILHRYCGLLLNGETLERPIMIHHYINVNHVHHIFNCTTPLVAVGIKDGARANE